MGQSLFSPTWYRVAEMKPRIRNHVRVSRHIYRGRNWYLLSDRITGKYHRVSQQAWQVLGLLDGRRTLQQVWETTCARLKENMPTQDEVIDLLAGLHRNDMLMADIPPDTEDLKERMCQGRKRKLLQSMGSPLSIKLPLLDPDRFLNRIRPLTDPLVSKPVFWIWLVTITTAAVLALMNFDPLTQNMADRILGMENLCLLWAVYPLVKLAHELGHAATVKKWGGEIHDVGILFLVLMPIPYVDASAAACFSDKKKRMVVDGAGIMVELFLASLALFSWLNMEPGVLRSVCFNIMVIAGISTLLFNGNPLLKFDAYFLLSDWLEIPNLATRSHQYMGYVVKRYLLGIVQLQSPVRTRAEGAWLISYGAASFFYRIFISIRIALFLAGKFFIVGVMLALWSILNMGILSLYRLVQKMATDPELAGKRSTAFAWGLGLTALILGSLFFLPLPHSHTTEGVTRIQEEGLVHAGAQGILMEMPMASGTPVDQGTSLYRLYNPEYEFELRANHLRTTELKAKLEQTGLARAAEYQILQEELKRLSREKERLEELKRHLQVDSPVEGIFLKPSQQVRRGVFYRRGQAMGYVLDVNRAGVQVVIHGSRINEVRQLTQRVELRFASHPGPIHAGHILREIPTASHSLPDLALSIQGGGDIALDPENRENPLAFEKYFQLEIGLDPELTSPGSAHPIHRIGERVYVKFVYASEPLIYRINRYISRVFMRRFQV